VCLGRRKPHTVMPRLRVRRLPEGTFELLLNLTNRHVHAQLVDRHAGRVLIAVHSTQEVGRDFPFVHESPFDLQCPLSFRSSVD
jgi:ribosomal protein L18